MIRRLIKPLKTRSYFIFGARGTGKSTWLRATYSTKDILYINLLDPDQLETFLLNPSRFADYINSKENRKKLVVVDEIQRVPALLDIIHDSISKEKRVFVLTGSSARRLKQAGTNLMAGRASVYYLFPFSFTELGDDFDLQRALERGLLPDSYLAESEQEAYEFLKSYLLTYVEKEIQQEQWIRKIEPFRKFLNICAQMNSKILNKSKIAREIGVESSSVESYLEIMEDTLLGFRLPGYATSIRKQVRLADKFYFIDTGIVRAIEKTLNLKMNAHNSYYGALFETFVVMEFRKFIEYNRLEWSLSYFQTKEGVEIDLVITRPRKSPILIEIKSTEKVELEHCKSLLSLGVEFDSKQKEPCPKILISQDKYKKSEGQIDCWHYLELWTKLQEL